jgi:hypothetical protein
LSNWSPPPRAKKYVFERGEVGDQLEVLVDHRHPVSQGVLGVLYRDRFAFDQDLAFVGAVEAEEDVHQGGLAGAVLT